MKQFTSKQAEPSPKAYLLHLKWKDRNHGSRDRQGAAEARPHPYSPHHPARALLRLRDDRGGRGREVGGAGRSGSLGAERRSGT